jgi:hypothetical protein
VNDVAVMVGQNLNLDVARPIDEPFNVERAVPERGERFASRLRDGRKQGGFLPHTLHADAPAPFRRLDQDRKPQAPRGRRDPCVGLIGRRLAGHHRYACLRRHLPGRNLRAHARDDAGGRPDEGDACRRAGRREVVVFGEKSVAGMDGVGARLTGRRQHRVSCEIAVDCRCRPDADGALGQRDVQRGGIGVRIDGHRFDAKLAARADHAYRNLAAIGDQDPGKHSTIGLRSIIQ